MCATRSNYTYTEYFHFIHEYYLGLDGKGFWMLNKTRVIDIIFIFFFKNDPWQKTETERRISL